MTELLTSADASAIEHRADDRTGSRRVRLTGVAAGLVAAAVNTGVAAISRELGVSLAVADEAIPLLGFAQLTFVAALLGTALAAVCNRRALRPSSVFVRLTSTLTALSMIPVIIVDTDTSTRLVLTATHAIAAVLIVGPLARRLNR